MLKPLKGFSNIEHRKLMSNYPYKQPIVASNYKCLRNLSFVDNFELLTITHVQSLVRLYMCQNDFELIN